MEKTQQKPTISASISSQFRLYPYFLVIGGIGYGINIGLTFIFTEYVHLWYLVSFMIAAILSLTCTFILNSTFTFKGYSRESHSRRYALYIGFYVLSAAATFISVYFLTSIFDVHYLISITAVTLLSSIVTFMINKRFIFLHS